MPDFPLTSTLAPSPHCDGVTDYRLAPHTPHTVVGVETELPAVALLWYGAGSQAESMKAKTAGDVQGIKVQPDPRLHLPMPLALTFGLLCRLTLTVCKPQTPH